MGPGKSWNFNFPKSRPGYAGKSILVMESHEKLKFYITLTKYFTYFNFKWEKVYKPWFNSFVI
jgi:hypothetical protein